MEAPSAEQQRSASSLAGTQDFTCRQLIGRGK